MPNKDPLEHVPNQIIGYHNENLGWHKKESQDPRESVIVIINGKAVVRTSANWIKLLLADVIKHIGVANGKKT